MIYYGDFILKLVVFISGLFLGSFINVIIYRIPREESIVSPRSRCPECGQKLRILELVPLISFVILRGKCSQCGQNISWRYPLVEFITGFLFILNFMFTAGPWEFVSGLFFIFFTLPLIFIDIDFQILPDRLTLTGMACGLILSFIRPGLNPLMSIAGVLAGGTSLLLVAMITKGGMGGGDIKLLMCTGAFLGPHFALLSIFLGAFLGLLVSLPQMVRGQLGLKSKLPFGPYLVIAALILWFWGAEIIGIYWHMLI